MKISILIPVYNAEDFIRETIASIENQTLAADEIIMVNDGSKDASWEILQSLAEKNPRIKVYDQENAGPSVTRNRAVEYAKNDWICFVDADDLLHPQRLEIASKFTKNVDAVICNFKRFSKQNMPVIEKLDLIDIQHLTVQESNESVLKHGFGLPRMLMKKLVFLASGGLDTDLVNNEDHELHFRMLTQHVKFKKIEAELYFYRQHQSESRLTNQKNSIDFIYKALDKMLAQISALPIELQPMAKVEIGNRIASNAMKQARLGQKDYKKHLKIAKELNPNLKPYKKPLLNIISKFFGWGTLERLSSRR